jgi:NADPH-dependent glutamate synthase beta subunit-like oxidoreductase
VYAAWLGDGWKSSANPQTGQLASQPKVFIGQEYSLEGFTVVEAAAAGRRAACAIDETLRLEM